MTTFDFSWSIILSIVLFLPLCVFYPTESNDMDFDTQPCLTALYVQLMLRKLVIILVGLMRMRLDSFTFHSETLAVSIPLLLSTGHYKLHTRLKDTILISVKFGSLLSVEIRSPYKVLFHAKSPDFESRIYRKIMKKLN